MPVKKKKTPAKKAPKKVSKKSSAKPSASVKAVTDKKVKKKSASAKKSTSVTKKGAALEAKISKDIEALKKDIELVGASKTLTENKKMLKNALRETVEIKDLVAKMQEKQDLSDKQLAKEAQEIAFENADREAPIEVDEISADVHALWYDTEPENQVPVEKRAKKKQVEEEEDDAPAIVVEDEDDAPHYQEEEAEEDVSEESIPLKSEEIDEKLSKIYKNKDGSLPDMKHFKKRRGGRFFRALFSLIFSAAFVAGVVYVGLFYLTPSASFSQDSVLLEIEGDEKIAFAGDVRYRIRYRNTSSVGLDNVVLQVKYPEGFVFKDASIPIQEENYDKFDIGFLQGYEGGFIDIFGKMYGDVGKSQSIRAFINYIPVNFSSEFQKVDSLNIAVENPEYDLQIVMPTEVVAGDIVEAQIDLSNLPEAVELSQFYLQLQENESFVLQSSSLEEEPFFKGKFSLASLEEDKKAIFTGVFVNPEDSGDTQLVFNLLGTTGQAEEQTEYIYATKELPVTVLETDVVSRLVINGATKQLDVQPGEVLSTSIFLQNEGKTNVEDVRVFLRFDTPSYDEKSMLSWADRVDDRDGTLSGEQINENTRRGVLEWSSETVPEFASIGPGEEVIIDVALPIRNAQQIDLPEFSTFEILANLEVQYEVEGEKEILTQKPIELTVNSDLEMELVHEVEEDSPKHTISWILSNNFHELQNVMLEAEIYGDITWLSEELSVPAGEFTFATDTQKILWNIESYPLGVDVFALQFAFNQNTDNPSQTNLTSKVNLKAIDVITGKEILQVIDGVKLIDESIEEEEDDENVNEDNEVSASL